MSDFQLSLFLLDLRSYEFVQAVNVKSLVITSTVQQLFVLCVPHLPIYTTRCVPNGI